MKRPVNLKELYGKKKLLATMIEEYDSLERELSVEKPKYNKKLQVIYLKYDYNDTSKPYTLSLAIEIDKIRHPIKKKEQQYEDLGIYINDLKTNIDSDLNKILTNGYEPDNDYEILVLTDLKNIIIKKQNYSCPICGDALGDATTDKTCISNSQVLHSSCKNYMNNICNNICVIENNR
tara:strand:- start:10027 stop:10560 length:534 start_codon:yes stop_codon:yes gene_type:complete